MKTNALESAQASLLLRMLILNLHCPTKLKHLWTDYIRSCKARCNLVTTNRFLRRPNRRFKPSSPKINPQKNNKKTLLSKKAPKMEHLMRRHSKANNSLWVPLLLLIVVPIWRGNNFFMWEITLPSLFTNTSVQCQLLCTLKGAQEARLTVGWLRTTPD